MAYTYDYPRALVCVDCIVFSENKKEILLIQRAQEPFKQMWALPGGFIEMEETLEESAMRELEEETGLRRIPLKQLAAFGNPGRDPRGRTISVVFWAEVKASQVNIKAGSDAAEAQWFSVSHLPVLAFDHQQIIETALRKTNDE